MNTNIRTCCIHFTCIFITCLPYHVTQSFGRNIPTFLVPFQPIFSYYKLFYCMLSCTFIYFVVNFCFNNNCCLHIPHHFNKKICQ